jgi:hypothetical protein
MGKEMAMMMSRVTPGVRDAWKEILKALDLIHQLEDEPQIKLIKIYAHFLNPSGAKMLHFSTSSFEHVKGTRSTTTDICSDLISLKPYVRQMISTF